MQKNGHSASTLQIYSQVQCLELPLIALKHKQSFILDIDYY